MDERLQRLQLAAAEGDVDALFSILAEDPLVSEHFDEKAFFSTPLHSRKRGKDPICKGNSKLKAFICFELVHVKSRGMVTPLHYAAQLNDISNLAEFLYVCPSSIQDLTVKCETVVHEAIKNGSCKALKVLLGCLQHFNKEEILRWEDEEENNALHTAISENQTEVVKLLIKYMEVNRKNRQGLTALDIFYNRHDSLNAEVEEILLVSKAKRASEVAVHPRFISRLAKLPAVENSPVTYYSRKLPLAKCIRKSVGVVPRA
ncbi:hypothetical protein Pint_16749 [Pistacia integerrima]|uniref:Uncharacterized protein n=1 Tax=Pistacia integerrima TaxID=434235 RepID=A0ACC0ZDT1_9ROSI|nr:hypothetical protein Pint_16749 [Pistacia integerrima]